MGLSVPLQIGNLQSQSGVGNATTTPIVQDYTVGTDASLVVFVGGVRQVPVTDYSTNPLTFVVAPASSVQIDLLFLGLALAVNTPAPGTVGLAELSATGTPTSSIFLRGDNTWAAVDTGTTANKILQLDGSAKIPAVDGSLLTNLPDQNDGALSLAVQNLFEISKNHDLPAGVAGEGFFDEFVADNLATKTNATYDATNDLYNNTPALTEHTGLTSGMITNTGSSLGAFSSAPLVDNVLNQSSGFYTNSAQGNGGQVHIDLGSGNDLALLTWEFYVNGSVFATWKIEYSDNNSSWTQCASGLVMDGLAGGASNSVTWSDVGSHRYWRAEKTGGNGNGGYHTELRVYYISTSDNMTLIPSNTTITANPTDLRFHFIIDEVDSLTLGTDITVNGTRDGGSTYSACTLTLVGTIPGGDSHIKAEVDVSGQPTGTAMKYKVETFNTKQLKFKFSYQLPIYA